MSCLVECIESCRVWLQLSSKSLCLQLGKPVVPASKLAEGRLSSDKARGRMRRCLRPVDCSFTPESTGITNSQSLPAHPKVSFGQEDPESADLSTEDQHLPRQGCFLYRAFPRHCHLSLSHGLNGSLQNCCVEGLDSSVFEGIVIELQLCC